MSPHEELLAALTYIRDRTGDPNAWQAGLTPREVAAVVNPATRSEQLGTILGKVRQQHPDLFGARTPVAFPPDTPPDREQGAAADAIAQAEAALAHQNTASARLDMQVIAAILGAHLKSVEGGQALDTLQREIEVAVQTRSDLDTPAGARDFQRLLIGKLRDIRAVVLDAGLDDTSKSALMAAWTALYDAAGNGSDATGEQQRAPTVPAPASPENQADAEWDPLLDATPLDDPGFQQGSGEVAPAATPPATAALPSVPGFGGGSVPNLGVPPGSLGGWGLPLSALQDGTRTDPALREPGVAGPRRPDDPDPGPAAEEDADHPASPPADNPDPPTVVPTTVMLPDGDTLTAASPQLAAVIKAAVSGVPIPDAFRQQGITIPAPGTAITDPLDPLRLAPGDIGIFADRHALALSPGKALIDGQIQHIAAVGGPSFLGWEHPPAPTATAAAQGGAETPGTPAPTRPAAAPTTSPGKPAGPAGGA